MKKLSQREIRTVKIGAVCTAAILIFTFGTEWLERWKQVRKSLAQARAKLKDVRTKQAGPLMTVPVFEMPEEEEIQKFLFRDKFNEQLKKAGIKNKPLQILSPGKSTVRGYKLLRIKCSGKCQFGQVLDLLSNLKENPYLVGIEEFKITCDPDPKKRKEIDVDLTVSTFVKS